MNVNLPDSLAPDVAAKLKQNGAGSSTPPATSPTCMCSRSYCDW